MADRGINDDGSIADLPWASVFDPAANVRALSAIQARGFRAATEVISRFVRIGDAEFLSGQTAQGPDGAAEHSADNATAPIAGLDVDRMAALWQDMIGRLSNSLLGAASNSSPPDMATFDLTTDNATGQVTLEATDAGAVSTEVWLHNGGAADLGKVRLRCSDLLAHDGALIDCACVRFEPDMVPMPARSSRGVTVEVDVAEDHAPGCYRGTLLAEGHSDVWMPVVLNIRPRV